MVVVLPRMEILFPFMAGVLLSMVMALTFASVHAARAVCAVRAAPSLHCEDQPLRRVAVPHTGSCEVSRVGSARYLSYESRAALDDDWLYLPFEHNFRLRDRCLTVALSPPQNNRLIWNPDNSPPCWMSDDQ
eukprot:3314525-Rhodomonas_salina.1